MQIILFSALDEQRWNSHCRSFWQTTDWQKYVLAATPGAINRSFFIEQDGHITGIVPLVQEGNQFTFQGGPTPACICRPEDEKALLSEVRRLAILHGVKHILIQGHVRGYLDASTWTCIIDPANPTPTKGCRQAIAKAEKHLNCFASWDTATFRDDYYRIAGKVTRPPATFDILGDWIKRGLGTLLRATLDGRTVGYTYILHWRDYGYYFMSCTEPDAREYNVGHYLQARAFDVLWHKGVTRYELGEQVYNTLHHQSAEKERSISQFKRSFGGEIVLNPASEYFFDPDYMRATFKDRLKNYLEAEYDGVAELAVPSQKGTAYRRWF